MERILRHAAFLVSVALTVVALAQPVDMAKADLAKRLGLKASEVRVISSQATTWPEC